MTYRKRFHALVEWQGQRVQLKFEGVMMYAEVSLNGHLFEEWWQRDTRRCSSAIATTRQ